MEGCLLSTQVFDSCLCSPATIGVGQAMPSLEGTFHKAQNRVKGLCRTSGLVTGDSIWSAFGRLVRGLPFPMRAPGAPISVEEHFPWHLGPAAKGRILRFKIFPKCRHDLWSSLPRLSIHQGWPRQPLNALLTQRQLEPTPDDSMSFLSLCCSTCIASASATRLISSGVLSEHSLKRSSNAEARHAIRCGPGIRPSRVVFTLS